MNTRTITIDQLIATHANDIAFAADTQPTTNPEDFLSQLQTAATNLVHYAGINGAEDLDTAHTYLSDAIYSDLTRSEQTALLKKAARYLKNTDDLVEEFRLMV